MQSDVGCCVSSKNGCKFTTRGSCDNKKDGKGDDGFYKDTFCSNDNLNCECSKKNKKGCVVGVEDVVWFDSCGNVEYLGHHDAAEDCDYGKGTLCSTDPKKGAYCKSIHCNSTAWPPSNPRYETYKGGTTFKDKTGVMITTGAPHNYDGGARENGESWCEYDSKAGPGLDAVGARHYRHICINGEEVVEPCRDYREEYCFQAKDSKSGKMQSKCITNKWKDCASKCMENQKELDDDATGDDLAKAARRDLVCCKSVSKACVWQWEDRENTSGLCMPLVSPGGKFWQEGSKVESLCEDGDFTDMAVWTKGTAAQDYKCKENCEMYDDSFLKFKNQFCRALGDCGAHYNYLGGWSNDALYRTWEEGSGDDLVEEVYPDVLEWLKDPKNFSEAVWKVGDGLMVNLDPEQIKDIDVAAPEFDVGTFIGVGAAQAGGALGLYVGSRIALPTASFASQPGAIAKPLGMTVIGQMVSVVAFFVTLFTGDNSAMISTAVGSTLTAVLTVMSTNPYSAWLAAIIAVLAWIFSSLELDETRDVTVSCEPWQPPTKGKDCAKCDDDPYKLCSEYRCKSLGQTCKFIKANEGTNKPKCYDSSPHDVNKPVIQPLNDFKISTKGYDLSENYKTKLQGYGYGFSDKIPSYSTITFGVTTNELSQCKASRTLKYTYSEMSIPFPDSYYSKEHNYTIYGLVPNKTYNYYLICSDPNGNPQSKTNPYRITFETDTGPDLTPPSIAYSKPASGGRVKYGENLTIAKLYIDEMQKFRCKYDVKDVSFDLMKNNMSCVGKPLESLSKRYGLCAAKLDMSKSPMAYYFRCKDKSGNENVDAYRLSLSKSSKLDMSDLCVVSEGKKDCVGGSKIFAKNVTLNLNTLGGSDKGKAVCKYTDTYSPGSFNQKFFNTNSTTHSQDLIFNTKGLRKMKIECKDSVGNEVSGKISFTIDIDKYPPAFSSIYKSGSNINVKLDEKVVCEYSSSSFTYGYGMSLGNTYKDLHALPSGKGALYVRCKDKFGNPSPEIRVSADVKF